MLRPKNDQWRVLSGIGDPENFPVQSWVHEASGISAIVQTEGDVTRLQLSASRMRRLTDEQCQRALSDFGVPGAVEIEPEFPGVARIFEAVGVDHEP